MKPIKILFGALGILVIVGAALVTWQAFQLAPDVELGAASPDVVLTSLDDEPLAVADLRGRFVLLDFWSST
jgi:cytochrome oxidase Cu insertion factor (SCO1/SenC/PrrC family)